MFRFIFALLVITLLVSFGFYFGYSNLTDIEVNLLFVKVKTNIATTIAVSFTVGFIVSLFFHFIWLGLKKICSFTFRKNKIQTESTK